MKRVFLVVTTSLIISSFFVNPVVGVAQNRPYDPTQGTSGISKTFSGISFTGIGGAIAGCTNVGGLALNSITSLFGKKASGDTARNALQQKLSSRAGSVQSVPTTDSASTEELKKANKVTTCLNGVANAAAKNLLQQMSNKTLNWINKGLSGNPLYVQDVASNLQSIRNEKLQSYLNTVQTSNPIFGNAIRSAMTQQITGISDGYLNRAMNTPEGQQYQAFQSDFTQGGWGAMLNMNNNPIGALFNSADKISQEINTEEELRVNEIQRNDGFLDMKECVEYEKLTAIDPSATTITNAGGGLKCLKYRTTTPGSIISSQAETVLGSPTRQLELADSINEVLGAFFDQMLNGLFQKGLSALQGKNSGSYTAAGGFGQNVILGSNGLPLTTTNQNAFGYQSSNGTYSVQDFDISRPQQLRAIIQAQRSFLNTSRDSIIALRSIVPTLGGLDYCIPGPNPTWTNGLNDNYISFISSLETPTEEKSRLLNIIGSTILGFLNPFGSGDKEIKYALAGEPQLFDKASGTVVAISPWSYLHYVGDYSRELRSSTGENIRNLVRAGYDRITARYQNDFTEAKIVGLFTAVDPNTAYATGSIKTALRETTKIVDYSNSLFDIEGTYAQSIEDTEDAILELESIRAEALEIVKIAKARHIAQQAAAGTPVNMTCFNRAYVIDESVITGRTRQESDIPNPIIQQSSDAADYFYSTL